MLDFTILKPNFARLFSKKNKQLSYISKYNKQPVATYEYSVADGVTQDIDLLNFLDRRPAELSIRSTQNVSIKFDADERKYLDEQSSTATLYASTPLAVTGDYRMVQVTNNSGSTATIRIIAIRNEERTRVVK